MSQDLFLFLEGVAWSRGLHRLEDVTQHCLFANTFPSRPRDHFGPLPFVASEGCQLSLDRARPHRSNAPQARASRWLQQFAALLLPYAGWLVLERLQIITSLCTLHPSSFHLQPVSS